jgi:hypothetical protein
MKTRLNPPKPAVIAFAAATIALCAVAADDKANPAGIWNWTITTPNGDNIQTVMKLKLEDGKLAGTVTGRGGMEAPISEAKLNDNEISFEVVRERNNNRFVSKYNGWIAGDTIKGKLETNFGGEKQTRDWEAKRGAPKDPGVTGTWRYSFTGAGGQSFEATLKLKQEDDKITGALIFNQNEAPISDGQVKDGEISFNVVRERDGQKFTSKYKGKVDDATFKGRVDSNFGSVERTEEFEAKRVRR